MHLSYPIRLSRLAARASFALCLVGIRLPAHAQVAATNDFFFTQEGTALTVPAPGVLANDTGGGPLTATLVAPPVNGVLTFNTNGSFVYNPTNNFAGMDGFTYRAVSGSQTSTVASVDLMVLAPGELFYDNFSRPTAGGSVFPWTSVSNLTGYAPILGTWGITNSLLIGNSFSNCYGYAYFNTNWTDYSVQAQIRFAANNAASAGLLGRLNAATSAHYDVWVYPEASTEPLGSNGTAILRIYKHRSWTAYAEIGNPVKLPGVGVDWHTVKLAFKGTNISAYFDGVLTLSVTDNGSVDATPILTNGGIGLNMWMQYPVAYTFSVANLLVFTTNAVANYDTYTATTNTPLHVPAPGVLANDAAPGLLTAALVSGPTQGSLTLTNNGGFSYTPNNGFSGTDSFTYQCTDGQTTSAVATVVIAVNDWVRANNDAYGMSSNRSLTVGAPGVMANDQAGTGPWTAILDNGPADGSLTLTNNGGFKYTPVKGFVGLDSFTYHCHDNQSTSRLAVATINVVTQEPPPVILALGLTNNNVAVTWSSAANLIYRMQHADSLDGANWTDIPPTVTATGPTTTETNAVGSAPQQFYRISLLTP